MEALLLSDRKQSSVTVTVSLSPYKLPAISTEYLGTVLVVKSVWFVRKVS